MYDLNGRETNLIVSVSFEEIKKVGEGLLPHTVEMGLRSVGLLKTFSTACAHAVKKSNSVTGKQAVISSYFFNPYKNVFHAC